MMSKPLSKIRSSAKGKNCQVRIPGVCNYNPETTVAAHMNGGGMGRKVHDIFSARCCSSCHDAVDGRVACAFNQPTLHGFFIDGVLRTQQQLIDEGLILARDDK